MSDSKQSTADEQNWFLPPSILPSNLTTSIGALNQYLDSPPSLDEETKTLLRPARKRRIRAPSSDSDAGSEAEDRPLKIRKKKAVETQIYKSAAFIEDSDDDEEADRLFFEREKRLREEMRDLGERVGGVMEKTGRKKRKGKGKEKGKEKVMEVDVDEVQDADLDVDVVLEGDEDDIAAMESE